jgi:hypothetical protein
MQRHRKDWKSTLDCGTIIQMFFTRREVLKIGV